MIPLSLLPAAPTLAQAFPILGDRTTRLPPRLARVLRAQWPTTTAPRFDLRRAYAFHTPAGTGYVVLDRRARWLCILVPGPSSTTAGGRCERVTFARRGQPPLALRISGSGRGQEIVALLPRGATASAGIGVARTRPLQIHDGVLAVVTYSPVTISTTVSGSRHSSKITYVP